MSDWPENLEKTLTGTASREEFIDAISYWLGTALAQKVSNVEEAISRKISWQFPNELVFSVGTDMHPTLSSLLEQVGEDDETPVPEHQLDSWAWSASVNGWILKVDKFEFPDAIQILDLIEELEDEHGTSTLMIPWADSWAKRFAAEINSDDVTVETMHKLCTALLHGDLERISPWELVFTVADESISESSDYKYFMSFLAELENRRIALVALDIPSQSFNDGGLTSLRQAKPELAELPAVGIFSESIGSSFFGNGSISVSVDTSSSVDVEQQFRELTDEFELDSNQNDDVFDEGWEPEGRVIFASDLWFMGEYHWYGTQRAIKRYSSSVDALVQGTATEEQLVEAITNWIKLIVPKESGFWRTPLAVAVSKRTCWLFPNDLLLVVSMAPAPLTLVSLKEVVPLSTPAPVDKGQQAQWFEDSFANGWSNGVGPLPRADRILSAISMLTELHGKPKLILPWVETWANSVEPDEDALEFTAAHIMFANAKSGDLANQSPWEVEFVPAEAYLPATCTYMKFVRLLEEIETRKIAIVVRDALTFDADPDAVRNENPDLAQLPVLFVFCNWGEENYFGNGRVITVDIDIDSQNPELETTIHSIARELNLDLSDELDLSFVGMF